MIDAKGVKKFNQLFNEYYPRFIRFAMGYVRNEYIAEDFVSEAFTVYWENLKDLDPDTKPQAYILTVIRNKCLNHLQHLKIKNRIKSEITQHAEWKLNLSINTLEACNPDFLFSDEIQLIINETLNSLPDKTKQIFILSRFENLTYSEIARRMNLTDKSIEYHISKALEKFRISLKEFMYILVFVFLQK